MKRRQDGGLEKGSEGRPAARTARKSAQSATSVVRIASLGHQGEYWVAARGKEWYGILSSAGGEVEEMRGVELRGEAIAGLMTAWSLRGRCEEAWTINRTARFHGVDALGHSAKFGLAPL